MSAGQMELESTADKRRRVEEELNVRKTQAAEARKLLDQLRTEASRLKARKDSLEEILSHRAYTAESVKRLFTAIERGEAEDFHAAGVLADFVEVEPAYEKATEEFLHEELEYVVVAELERCRARDRPHAYRPGRPRDVPGASRGRRPDAGAGNAVG